MPRCHPGSPVSVCLSVRAMRRGVTGARSGSRSSRDLCRDFRAGPRAVASVLSTSPLWAVPSQLLVPVPVPPPAAAGDARPTRPRRGSAPLCCLPCQSRWFPKPREFCGSWRSFCSVLAPSWTWAPSRPARRALGRTRAVRSRGGGGAAAGHPGFPPRQRPEGFGTGKDLEGAGRVLTSCVCRDTRGAPRRASLLQAGVPGTRPLQSPSCSGALQGGTAMAPTSVLPPAPPCSWASLCFKAPE